MDEVLQDQPHRTVVRVGDTVRRPVQPWSPSVHALLGHLEAMSSYRHPGPADRRRRIAVFAKAYGIAPDGLEEQVVAQQELVRRGCSGRPRRDGSRNKTGSRLAATGKMPARIAWSRRYSRRNVAP
ncbi:hypothetical protein [Dactylosporangium sp. CS-033363]|uniref:hypothetical protein n=1 Tax=Dactylosporangium sp. CS-033363 TaxID=3239935 RepID=UPI003D8AE1C7